jgi:hypothetical protein
MHADADKQGLVQGMITGVRGLCNGLGPAMFGLIFSLFHVDLNEKVDSDHDIHKSSDQVCKANKQNKLVNKTAKLQT